MYIQDTTVSRKDGLCSKAAGFFTQKANEFTSDVWIEINEMRISAKSLLGILSLGVMSGSEVTLMADGSDEKAAVSALMDFCAER